MKVPHECEISRCLFIVSAYAPTICSSDAAKDSFYDALRALLRRAETSDIVVVAGDMNAQVGRLSTDEAQVGAVCVLTRSARKTVTGLCNCVQTTIYFYAVQTFATNGPV